MNITIHSKNLTLSSRLQEYADNKVGKLERYLPNIIEARLDLRKEKHRGKDQPIAQLTVRNDRGIVLRAEDKKQEDLFAAVDVVVDKMYKQISRYKGKTQRKKGHEKWIEAAPAWDTVEMVPVSDADIADDYDSVEPRVVLRRKVVSLTPMSEQEAIDQMELLGHDFFVFYNGEEDTINVLYRREDNHFGILTPQID